MPSVPSLTLLAVVTALAVPGPAAAQQGTTPLGDYAPPGTTSTVETAPRPAGRPAPARAGTAEAGSPARAPAPVLASTGFEAGVVALAGLLLMGAAAQLQRRARPRP